MEVYFEQYCYPEGEWKFANARPEYINPESGIVGYRGTDKTGSRFYNHMPAKEIKSAVGDDVWNSYYKFTTIRNPFDKMVSAFYHFEKSKATALESDQDKSDIERFRRWIRRGGPTIDRSVYMIDDQIAMNFFIRYEHLLDDIEAVCKKLNVIFDSSVLPSLKNNFRDRSVSLRDMYDAETEARVRELFKFEIDQWGYHL